MVEEAKARELKDFDQHTAVFIVAVVENLPHMSGPLMDMWMKKPEALQKALWFALCPPNEKIEEIPGPRKVG